MTLPNALSDILAGLVHDVQDLKRRRANGRRTGVVEAVDRANGRYRVRLRTESGAPMLTPWIPARTIAAGAIRAVVAHAVGEQVVVTSESGDLDDAEIAGALPSAAAPGPSAAEGELIIEIGTTRLALSPSAIRLTADTIVLEGDVALGGEGGEPVHLRGQKDSAQDTAVEGATRVTAI